MEAIVTDLSSSQTKFRKKSYYKFYLKKLRVSLKHRPKLYRLLLKMHACIRKKSLQIINLKKQMKEMDNNQSTTDSKPVKEHVTKDSATQTDSDMFPENTEKLSSNASTVKKAESVRNIEERKSIPNQAREATECVLQKATEKPLTNISPANKAESGWNFEEGKSIADQVKEAAESALLTIVEKQLKKSSNTKDIEPARKLNDMEDQSIADQVKEAAKSASQQSRMVYIESAGMYYDYNTGYYYNPELGLYYHSDTGCYYRYNEKKELVFHSYPVSTAAATNPALEAHEKRKARKQRKDEPPTKAKRRKKERKESKSKKSKKCVTASEDSNKESKEFDNNLESTVKDSAEADNTKSEVLENNDEKSEVLENNDDNSEVLENIDNKSEVLENNDNKSEILDSKSKDSDEIKNEPDKNGKENAKPEAATTEMDISKKTKDEKAEIDSNELEDGECSETESESEESSSDVSIASTVSMPDYDAIAKHHPPSMRVIIKETKIPKLKVGSLFLVTKDGGTVGREGEHHIILLKDHNVSKNHLDIKYDMEKRMYTVTDLGSKNGTILNGIQMTVNEVVSLPMEVVHGSTIQLGETKLLCHIHPGNDTCGHCEPGLIMEKEEKVKVAYTRTCDVKTQYELELARLKNKYKPQPLMIEDGSYNDRAKARREAVGSSHHSEKTQTADVHTHIEPENKGFKLLEKMGWSKGEGLGKDNQGETAPIPLINNEGTAGLGAPGSAAPAKTVPLPKVRNTLGPATLRLAARSKMLQPPAKAFQAEDLEEDE